jgi:DNA-binding MarR family transcriptional regulator
LLISSSECAKITEVEARLATDTEVAEFAGQLFFRLWRASHTRIAEALASIGLTPALFGVLNFLGAREGAIQLEIATAMGIDPSTLVTLIDELESAGLAKRRPHPKDRRAREVTLTPRGRRQLERARRMAFQVEDEVLQGLGASERRDLLSLLGRALDAAPPQSPWQAEEGD